ncbi:transposable element Tcb2 transposase [Trichonephila clavipes]|nr:transposable element Tcb2 transposase [Trichonephila clavipes]
MFDSGSYDNPTPLAHADDSRDVFQGEVHHSGKTIGDDFIIMDDNCRPHRANLVEDFLFEEGIVRMEWPAYSPDMNPIEHVCNALERRVAGRQPPHKLSIKWKELFWKSGTEYPNW